MASSESRHCEAGGLALTIRSLQYPDLSQVYGMIKHEVGWTITEGEVDYLYETCPAASHGAFTEDGQLISRTYIYYTYS